LYRTNAEHAAAIFRLDDGIQSAKGVLPFPTAKSAFGNSKAVLVAKYS